MKTLKIYIGLIIILSVLILLPVKASNTIGGDISWTCNGTGNYIFKLRLHVLCGGNSLPNSQTISVFNHPNINSIPVNQVSQTDISPVCTSSGNSINCNTGGQGAVLEYIYLSAPITIPGVPPPGGWVFTYSECCRNTNSNLNISSNSGLTFYSKILPSLNNANNSCIDNSVDFLRSPSTIACSSNQHTLLFFPFDTDLDSISSRWAEPLDDITGAFTPPINPTPIPFNSGYAYNNPFPNTGPGNSGAVLEPLSGKITFTSQINGNFTYALIFESWRCGVKISEIYKEFQLALISCITNIAPVIGAPFSGGFETTMVAGSNLIFNLTAIDTSTQNISWNISGDYFGTGFTNSNTGCMNPPCAVLNNPPPSTSLGINTTTFSWQTNCLHLGNQIFCNAEEKIYRFYFSASDNQCPVPAINNQVIIVHLKPPAILLSPEIKCISNGGNGNITIYWSTPPDPNNTFSKYVIYHSANINGPYDTLTSIFNYNQNQFSFISATGNSNNYYFIKSFGCGGYASSPAIDTVKPITLTVNNPSNGTAQLFWNAFVAPLPNSSCGWYKIFKEYPSGVWSLLDSTQNVNYTDTITICQSTINYRIEICDFSGCSSLSNTDGDIFLDQTDPLTPLLDSVSIDVNGNAVLGWQASPSQDVFAYVIYKKNGLVYVPIDTLYGNSILNYTYALSNASAGSETYALAAFDSCGNLSNLGLPQNTIFLTKQYDICTFTSILSWNPYINMGDGGLDYYEIQLSLNGGPWTILGTTNLNFFSHDSLIIGSSYCYKIVARSNGGLITSVSNQQCINAVTVNSPNFLYISSVTVSAGTINVNGLTDNSTGLAISGFDIYRANHPNLAFSQVGTVNYTGNAAFSFTDNDVNTNEVSYKYFLRVKDSCDNSGISSDTSRSILCNAFSMEDFKNKIIWNDYSKWMGGISSYNLYRKVNGILNTIPIANVPFTGSGSNFFLDDVNGMVSEEGKFEYFVEAIEGSGNPYGISATSLSNTAVVYRDAEIFVPNAFVPRGVNTIFKPVTQFVSHQEYKLSVYDRWGLLIWETTNNEEGWDGNGLPGGVYLWTIEYKNSRGENLNKKGYVVLIR